MRVKVLVCNKRAESAEQFEKRLNASLSSVGDIVELKAWESGTGDIVVSFTYSEKKQTEQEICVIAWSDLDTLESAVNNALSGLEETGRRGRFINFVTTAKASRALAVFVVEGDEGGTSDKRSEEQRQEKKQDQSADVKPKRGRKPKSVV